METVSIPSIFCWKKSNTVCENLHKAKEFGTHIDETFCQISLIARSDADIAIFGGDLNAQVHINIFENTN